jgi:hypothetical protein
MPLAQRKRVILVGLESTYGSDATPAAADAVLCSNLNLTPLEGSSVSRDFIRPFFGASGNIRVENFVSMDFETEIAGSGAAGTAPQWGILLKASNFSETITAAAITGSAQAGGTTTTVKLAAAASAVDDFYVGMTLAITAGTGNGQSSGIISYNGTSKVATLAKAQAVGADATSTYSISANVVYTPNSNFGTAIANTSASIYFNVDGVRHILLGARGTVSFDLSVKAIPKMKWKFTGLLGVISDQTLPTADFTGWQVPVTVSTANTTDINLIGYNAAVVQKLSFDIANTVIYRQMIGTESVMITDRKPTGSVSIEATSVAAKDWWTSSKNGTYGPFHVKHGTVAGNIVSFTSPNAQLSDPKYSDSDGIAMMDFTLQMTPFLPAGNDEVRITCK